MGELGALVQAWRDRQAGTISDSWIGKQVGVSSRSSVGPWLTGESMPSPENLRAIASLIGIAYRTALTAALIDAGYLEEREAYDFGAAPIGPVTARGLPAPEELEPGPTQQP